MTTPQPQGLPPLREIEPAFDHPEHHMKWTRSEIKWIKEYATDYAREALRAMPASRKDIEQAAFEKWLDKERPSGDVEQVQRQWEESSDYEEVQPAALLAEINHWHAIAKKLESELTALRAQAASVGPVAYMTEDGRTLKGMAEAVAHLPDPWCEPAQADAASEAFTGIANDDDFWAALDAWLARATLTAKERK